MSRITLGSSLAGSSCAAIAVAPRVLRPSYPAAFALLRNNRRHFQHRSSARAPGDGLLRFNNSGTNATTTYFPRSSLPANTVVRFVPQQTAWIVERMGKYNRILQPGLAILIPFLDRIAYVKSLKENAIEIPSQSAITADNVTLNIDGVLYTRVFDAYKARSVLCMVCQLLANV